MRLDIRGHLLPLTGPLRQFVARRLWFALSRFQDQIEEVTVRLSDEHRPKGGTDKVCRVVAKVSARRLFVKDADPDLHAAVSHAAERLERAVSRELEIDRVLRPDEFKTSTLRRRSKLPQSIQAEEE